MSIPSTKPATEQDLFVENDTHGFEEKTEIEVRKCITCWRMAG